MARRSAGRPPATAGDPAAEEWLDEPAPRRRRPRAGAGGRWWVWVGRVVLWAFLLVVIANGIWLPLRDGLALPFPSDGSAPQSEDDAPGFPETAAATFAMGFAEVYLNAEGEQRRQGLAGYMPAEQVDELEETGPALGASGLRVLSVEAEDDHNGVVAVAATVDGAPMRLDVPVYSAGERELSVPGPPALLAAPDPAAPGEVEEVDIDTEAQAELEEQLQDFFRAYAENPDPLDRYLAPGAEVDALPQGLLTFQALDGVTVGQAPVGEEDARTAQATVVWEISGSDPENPTEMTQSYQLTVVREGTDWFIRDIQGAPHTFG